MRLLVLCLSPGRGGLELYAWRELQQLQARGHVCRAMVAPEGMLYSRLQGGDVPFTVLKTGVRAFPLWSARWLAALLDAQEIDVLHIHWARDLPLAVLAKRLARRDVRLVYTRHMGITRSKRDPYHRFLYRHVDRMLVISQQVLREARQYMPLSGEQIELLYHGVAAAPLYDEQRCAGLLADDAIAKRQFKIGLFGRIEHGKGQHLLMEALSQLVQQGKDMGALVVGNAMDDGYYQELQEMVRESGLQDHVSFHSYMDNLQEVFACMDVVVLTTYCETFGLVLVEAMRAGVAVIGTRAGGVPEIIEHEQNGLLFEPGDAQGLTDSLARLYEDEDFCKTMAANGKLRADELFAEDRHYGQLETILTGLLR